ncbi:hypothetical protein [Aequorivita xiaoshiensis]|uniref:Lipoprotein n=1 Tax=Aequorivita xiaoshiensis TaxID=2874476 RepID=A0A9X1R1G1_9FLAO|nr:hypothetical protein [Aequorivita xiaoshiensis]MCG2431703.1 hypothetical protein [Aequorivita xiaoshiensis]
MVKISLLSLFVIILSCKNPFDEFNRISIDDALEITVHSQINERGGAILNEKYLFISFCPLISKSDNPEYQDIEIFYSVDKLVPYKLHKYKGENYFYIINKKDSLVFKLLNFE